MVGSDSAEDDDVLFLSLEGVHCVDLDVLVEVSVDSLSDEIVDELRLLFVRCDDAD